MGIRTVGVAVRPVSPAKMNDGGEQLRRRLGFRDGRRGTHASRSIMLEDLRALFAECPSTASTAEYVAAIVQGNILGRRTVESRRVTSQKLRELYGLDPALPVFRGMRRSWDIDGPGRPMLAFLCAFARDPLLRASSGTVLALQLGATLESNLLAHDLAKIVGTRFSEKTLMACGQRLASSWHQAGFISRGTTKVRLRATATAATAAYALFLGYLEGARGQRLFTTIWARLTDRSPDELMALIGSASQRGLLDFRGIGSIIEVRFNDWLTKDERELLREQA